MAATTPKHYTKAPESCDALKFTGNNQEDMIAFCPNIIYGQQTGKIFFNMSEVYPEFWIYKDMGGRFFVSDQTFPSFWSGAPQ